MSKYGPSMVDDFSDISHERVQDARFAVAYITAEALKDLAEVLSERARMEKSKTLFDLSIVAGMASQTAMAALELYHQEMWYAGAALTRQLVEHHYLCAYFAKDASQVSVWLDASNEEIKRMFSPSRVRRAGGFDTTDYNAHCTWGGHPNPHGTAFSPALATASWSRPSALRQVRSSGGGRRSPGRNAAHCPGLTARARPKARPDRRAANLSGWPPERIVSDMWMTL
jgi:hypothetical protein